MYKKKKNNIIFHRLPVTLYLNIKTSRLYMNTKSTVIKSITNLSGLFIIIGVAKLKGTLENQDSAGRLHDPNHEEYKRRSAIIWPHRKGVERYTNKPIKN